MMYLLLLIVMALPAFLQAQENTPETIAQPLRTLGSVLQQAVDNSDELNVINARIRQGQSAIGEARSSYYPQVTVSERFGRDAAYPSAARTKNDPRGASEYVNANTTKMEINQMVFDGFKTPSEVAKQEKYLEGLLQRRRSMVNEVTKNTLEVYLTAWRHLQALRAGVAMVDDMRIVKAKVDMQANLGAADQTVKSYVDSRLTGAMQELLKTRNAYREALFRLAYLLQDEISPESFTFGPLLAPTLQELDVYLMAARTESPELLEEAANKQAAEQELRKTRSGQYPTLSLTSDLQDTNDIGGSSGNVRSGNAMVQLSYKLFDGFATRHGTARAKEQIAESQFRLRRTSRQLEEDLSQAWRKVTATRQEAKLATDETTANLKVKTLRTQDVENGTGDIVRLIEAEEALYTTMLKQLDLVQLLTFKKYELTLQSGQLKNLACVDGGCAELPMEPVVYVNPVELTIDTATTPETQPDTTGDIPAPVEASPTTTVGLPPEESTAKPEDDTPRDYEAPSEESKEE